MKDVMIDLETLGTKPYSAIISIGACYFDPKTGEIGDTFHSVMEWGSIYTQGRDIDPDTVKWWMKQSDEARSGILEGDAFLRPTLVAFANWLEAGVSPWGNGATFDITMLENAYEACGIESAPWKFWNIRDVRTVVAMAKDMGYDWKDNNVRQGTYHNALDDAIYQARYVSDIWQEVIRGSLK